MRLITFTEGGEDHVGVRHGELVVPVTSVDPDLPNSLIELLEGGHLARLADRVVDPSDAGVPIADVDYRPLLPRPGKVICVGRNYAAHAAEGGADTPSYPEVFFRGATSLIGHRDSIVRPRCSEKLDYEGEIAFVIGKECRHATLENALDHVVGYTLFHDATLRDYQKFASQWTVGKNFDGTGALGPELVTADELPVGLAGLTLTTTLNGELMQTGNVDDLVFPFARLIEILSECMTLEVGDVVVTGTPSGVGHARTPPLYLKPGDEVEIHVPGLGTLLNTVQDEG